MAGNHGAPTAMDMSLHRRRMLPSYRDHATDHHLVGSETAANTPVQPPLTHSEASANHPGTNPPARDSYTTPHITRPSAATTETSSVPDPISCACAPRQTNFSPQRVDGGDDFPLGWGADAASQPRFLNSRGPDSDHPIYDSDDNATDTHPHLTGYSHPTSISAHSPDDALSDSRASCWRNMADPTKRSRDKFEGADGKNIAQTLHSKGAIAAVLYNTTKSDPQANDIWPQCRSSAKLPAPYFVLDTSQQLSLQSKSDRKASRKAKKKTRRPGFDQNLNRIVPKAHVGRPEWKLPVELVELIAAYLNRDDIKALRLTSRELNHIISQVIFRTVVVPFNTEIYGMIGQESKPDIKGKRRARIDIPEYFWKNANGDEVYNGHGLDVFRGFGGHIRKFGMSFEVNEDSLAAPPTKVLTEKKTSFWGDYDWPFEDYPRFDDVAGLETAADETPRMKIAFSELRKVKELALSVDSGLGWLNGPDRSIRARILRRPRKVFGTAKDIPDRRAHAQQELWSQVRASHMSIGSDVKLATLYRLDTQCPFSKLEKASMLAEVQPSMPYLDTQLIHEATPHETADIPVPRSTDDSEVRNHMISTPSAPGAGILFSSLVLPTEAGQILNPIIPAQLDKAQKEWLLETEWAQRAFISSYMLSVIDNPITFHPVHTLNISGISDRYLPMLHRSDFWDALPSLREVTIMVIPGWRTVCKDEAGSVDTPTINPAQGTDVFYDLLRTHVAHRQNIDTLTIGWVTGGEHAEGLHARNKLILPAPVTNYCVNAGHNSGFISGKLIDPDRTQVRASLLQLPYVKHLTLRNCWITPPILLEFIGLHDMHALQDLVLKSVSVTAVLRLNANQLGQQAAAVQNGVPALPLFGAGAFWQALYNNVGPQAIQAQFLPQQRQFLNLYLQALDLQVQQLLTNATGAQQHQVAVLQTRLQQLLQQLQGPAHAQGQAQVQAQQNVPLQPHAYFNNVANLSNQVQTMQQQIAPGMHAAHVPVAPNTQAAGSPRSALHTKPRQGSWLNIIDIISPGTNLHDFGSEYSQADRERTTSLRSVEFRSCGYVILPHAALDQSSVEVGTGLAAALRNPFFNKRQLATASIMLSNRWAHLAEVVQEVSASELAALEAGWDLKTGWDNLEEAQAVEFDGLLPGGTGRFTGIIRHSDRVADEASARDVNDLCSKLLQISLRL